MECYEASANVWLSFATRGRISAEMVPSTRSFRVQGVGGGGGSVAQSASTTLRCAVKPHSSGCSSSETDMQRNRIVCIGQLAHSCRFLHSLWAPTSPSLLSDVLRCGVHSRIPVRQQLTDRRNSPRRTLTLLSYNSFFLLPHTWISPSWVSLQHTYCWSRSRYWCCCPPALTLL
jgi:hypothetical protein